MNMDMDMELELNNFLESDSDFVDGLCRQLEDAGIHLNNDLLSKILLAYEERKTNILKGFLETILGFEDLPFSGEGPSIIHMMMDSGPRPRELNDENLDVLDSEYIV